MPSRPISSAYIASAAQLHGNAPQLEVYESKGNCVVLAGPGSGKTSTLVLKLARVLAEDVHTPRGVACITFSQEAARELTKRLIALGLRESSRLFIGTVHSFCLLHLLVPFAKLANLGLPDPLKVAPTETANRVFDATATGLFGTGNPYRKHEADLLRREHLNRRSEEWRAAGDYAKLADAYEAALRAEGLVDFEDLVHFGQRILLENDWALAVVRARFPVLAVDEYQDLGVGLHRIVERLVFRGGIRLLAVGDIDQAVYGFNGARSDLLEQLAARPDVERVRLSINYRSAQPIIDLAERALGQARGNKASDGQRQAKIETIQCEGALPGQARYAVTTLIPQILANPSVNLGDIAFLYRTANVGDVVAEAIQAAGHGFVRIDNAAPYRKTPLTSWVEDCASWCSGGWRAARPALRDLLGRWLAFHHTRLSAVEARQAEIALTAFLSHHRHTANAAAFVHQLRTELLDKLLKHQSELLDQAAALASLSQALAKGGALEGATLSRLGGRGGAPDQLNLLTLHSAKGTEYRAVIIVGLDQGVFPWRNESTSQFEESRRLFYVGVTRAEEQLYLMYSGYTEWQGRRFHNGPSVFLDGLI